MGKVIIIFGTTGGNTELVCDKVLEIMQNAGHETTMQHAENGSTKDIIGYDLCILASPTYGHGVLEDSMEKFLAELKKEDLKGKKFAVIGLGDSKYEINHMFESAIILTKALEEKEAELLIDSLRINKSPLPYLDTRVSQWAKDLSEKL